MLSSVSREVRAKDIKEKLLRKCWIFARASNLYNNFWEFENTPINQKIKNLEERHILQDCNEISVLGTEKSEQQTWQWVQNGPAGMRKGAVSPLKAVIPSPLLLLWRK